MGYAGSGFAKWPAPSPRWLRRLVRHFDVDLDVILASNGPPSFEIVPMNENFDASIGERLGKISPTRDIRPNLEYNFCRLQAWQNQLCFAGVELSL